MRLSNSIDSAWSSFSHLFPHNLPQLWWWQIWVSSCSGKENLNTVDFFLSHMASILSGYAVGFAFRTYPGVTPPLLSLWGEPSTSHQHLEWHQWFSNCFFSWPHSWSIFNAVAQMIHMISKPDHDALKKLCKDFILFTMKASVLMREGQQGPASVTSQITFPEILHPVAQCPFLVSLASRQPSTSLYFGCFFCSPLVICICTFLTFSLSLVSCCFIMACSDYPILNCKLYPSSPPTFFGRNSWSLVNC